MTIIARNRKAFHEYVIGDKFEAGIVLTGDEVKSLRNNGASLVESFAVVRDGQILLLNAYISPYSHAYTKKDASRRNRVLLLNRREINRIIGDISRKGMTLIPLKMYINKKGLVKLEVGLAKHKNMVNRKRELRDKDIARQASREIKMNIK